jgi:hypothetical protein
MSVKPSKNADPQSVVVCENNMLNSPGSSKMNVNSPTSGTIAMQELKEQVQKLATVLLKSHLIVEHHPLENSQLMN